MKKKVKATVKKKAKATPKKKVKAMAKKKAKATPKKKAKATPKKKAKATAKKKAKATVKRSRKSYNYNPSRTDISDLERTWRESRENQVDHLRMHQCAAALLAFDKTSESPESRDESTRFGSLTRLSEDEAKRSDSFEALFEDIGKRLGLNEAEVKNLLVRAKAAKMLTLGGRLAMDIAASLQGVLNDMRENAGCEPIPDPLLVIVGALDTKYQSEESDRIAAAAEAATDYFSAVVPTGLWRNETRRGKESRVPTDRWIGVCGGRTILKVVERIVAKSQSYDDLTVLPLTGEAEPEEFPISANSIVVRLAQGCRSGNVHMFSLMASPFVGGKVGLERLERWQAEQADVSSIAEVLRSSRRVKFAFAGIGSRRSESAMDRLWKYCQMKDEDYIPDDCVGDMCYRPMNENGKKTWGELYNRVVGLDLEDLKEMTKAGNRRVFAVACGREKVDGIIAAVKGGLVNGLITDELTALEILAELEDKKKRPKLRRVKKRPKVRRAKR